MGFGLISLLRASDLSAQHIIPVRSTLPATATLTQALGSFPTLRAVSGGFLLINDATWHRLLLADSTLSKVEIVADTESGRRFQYGATAARLIPFLGDSTLFADISSQSFLVLDASGKTARVAAAPKAGDFGAMRFGSAGSNARGDLLYRVVPKQVVITDRSGTTITHSPDSAAIVRADFASRSVDTVAKLKMHVPQVLYSEARPGGTKVNTVVVLPFSAIDDWAVAPDGTIVIVRGRDYHLEWISADGAVRSSLKLPFDWLRLSDEQKQQLADSARRVVQARLDSARARSASRGRASGIGLTGSVDLASGVNSSIPLDANVRATPLDSIPDYVPPIRPGSVLPDYEGNIWILPFTSSRAGSGRITYDVVNARGELFERVQLPQGKSIAGFGKDGALYLAWRDSSGSWHLERTRVER